MKSNNNKILIKIICMVIIAIFALQIKSNAVVVSTDKEVQAGNNVTISVTSRQALGAYKVQLTDAGGLTLISSAGGEVSADKKTVTGSSSAGTTSLATYTFSTPSVSKDTKYNIKFRITGMETPDLIEVDDETNTATVTVKAPETNSGGTTGGNTGNNQGGSTGNTGNNNGTTNKPTVTEPKFASASKTVYTTTEVNLRSSWSTSSTATKVAKGTELRLTGTSTEKVNGYVWYRVTYNGQVKYVVNNLITETKPEEEKSNNTNLKALSIENVELSPTFSSDVLQYTATLNGYEEKEIKVTAEAEDAKSTVKVEGNTNITVGENVITIEVTAEDGTSKTYKVLLTNEKKTTLGLQTLKIKDVDLKDFSPDKFEYEVSFKELEKLEIEAIANKEGATVEILGNESLVEGENVITIIVSLENEQETVTYQIKANKLKAEMQETKKELNIKNIVIYAVIALVILAIIIVLIVKYVKRKRQI